MTDDRSAPDPTHARRVGFVGLGNQGEPMARRLLEAGWPLTVWARRSEVTDAYGDGGATVAETPAEVGAVCDLVEVCLLDDATVFEVIVDRGVLAAMAPGSILAIHSTVHPRTCLQLAELAAKRGVRVLDAPVSGGAIGAAAGTLSVIVGGADDVVEYCRPVLATYAGRISHVGGIGAAQIAKLVNNALFTINLAIADEALRLGEELGIAALELGPVLQASSGRSFGLDIRVGHLNTPAGVHRASSLLDKDDGIIAEVLAEHGPPDSLLVRTALEGLATIARRAEAVDGDPAAPGR
jgi:3-hydroxyisobutyrate dehydrogenase-like beta-hydroxyacid dehydrogenase